MSTRLLRLVVATVIISILSSESANAQTSCIALVEIKNDLWTVRQNGALINRATSDALLKSAAALSPDGRLIAYSGVSNDNNVSIIDADGRVVATVDTRAKDAITGLMWVSTDIVRVQEHVSPTSGLYRFVEVPSSNPAMARLLPGEPATGSRCMRSPKRSEMACMQADTLLLNNRATYYTPDPFQTAEMLQSESLTFGSAIRTSTSPEFEVSIGNAGGQAVTIKVTLPDGSWQQSVVKYGEVFPIAVVVPEADGSSALFGFRPLRLHGKDDRENTITIAVIKSVIGETIFESDPTWSSDGSHLAFVELNASGERTLALIRREMGNANSPSSIITQKTALPLDGPIRSMMFRTNGQIEVTGQTQVYLGTPPSPSTPSDKWSYTLTPALPSKIDVIVNGVKSVSDVIGWGCP